MAKMLKTGELETSPTQMVRVRILEMAKMHELADFHGDFLHYDEKGGQEAVAEYVVFHSKANVLYFFEAPGNESEAPK